LPPNNPVHLRNRWQDFMSAELVLLANTEASLLILGIDYHGSNHGTGCETLEPSANELALPK
jgi:hypothetical protein